MPLTFKIASTDFAALAMNAGRYALSVDVGPPRYDVRRYHLKGVDGAYLTRGGRIGRRIKLTARYLKGGATALADLLADAETDRAAWANTAVTLQIPSSGASFARCQLEAVRTLRPPTAAGRGNPSVFMDLEFTFMCDS